MYNKLLNESEQVEEFLDQLEDRLEKYASEDKVSLVLLVFGQTLDYLPENINFFTINCSL